MITDRCSRINDDVRPLDNNPKLYPRALFNCQSADHNLFSYSSFIVTAYVELAFRSGALLWLPVSDETERTAYSSSV